MTAKRHDSVTPTRMSACAWSRRSLVAVGAISVCLAGGLDTGDYTFAYVGRWADGDVDLVRKTADRVVRTARTICDLVTV